MDDQREHLDREHHFYVSIAKFLFHHPEHGIVSVHDPIRLADAKQRGLMPIILYGITVAGLPVRWLTFSTVDQRKSLREVLLTAWRDAEGLRGRPDILRVNRYVAQADPALFEDLTRIGIRLDIADAKDKTVAASLRSAHNASRWLWQRHSPEHSSLTACVAALCLDAQDDHRRLMHHGFYTLSNKKMDIGIQKWLKLDVRNPPATSLEHRDWEAGPWLSSWEASLPPDQPRYFYKDDTSRRTWLLIGKESSESADDNGDEILAYEEYDNVPEIAKHLVACWPNQPTEIAAAIGVTLRQLQWFISRRANLDGSCRDALTRLLSLEYDERMGVYTPAGPYVLLARKAQAIETIYQEISGGGGGYPCELIPAQGQADPSWRYVLINAYSTSPTILMAPRGEMITERLPDLMMNYEGIRPVLPDFYRDVVATCARACRSPQVNVREMEEFSRRYEENWADCAWIED
ncbi:hypothetical protein P7L79_12150 [Tistrella mobilis]|uniref:hypothetical protein n=1 Tax=Tistrella mobilis TaxID=171437 RepID=UPI0035577685